MHEIDTVRRRVEAADGLAQTLAAARDSFELLAMMCEAGEDHRDELFAAFAFAAAAAVEGRHLIMRAPSLPPSVGTPAGTTFPVGNPAATAAALADVARIASIRLAEAARGAWQRADQEACQDAAGEARQIHDLLARG